MTIEQFLLKAIRKIYRTASNMPEVFHRKANNGQGYQYYGYVELYDQEANDYVREALETGSPCMVSKFGTIELNALTNYKFYKEGWHSPMDVIGFVKGVTPPIGWKPMR